jgi:hypothetical protein
MATMHENLCGNCVDRIELTFHRRAILKIVKSMCNGIKKIKCTLTKCHTNVNSIPPTQFPHKFPYIVAILIHNHFESIVAILIHNHFESPNMYFWITPHSLTKSTLHVS